MRRRKSTPSQHPGRKGGGVVEIARVCGVSPSTVCRALNGRDGVDHETRERIIETSRSLGYVRNSAASRLRGCGSKVIACITPDLSNELFIEKLHYLKQRCAEAGYRWQQSGFSNSSETESAILEILEARPAGIVIVSPGSVEHDVLDTAKRVGVPLVFYDSYAEGFDSVSVDRECGVYEAVTNLLAKGRKQILLLGAGPGTARGNAYVAAHREAGVEIVLERFIEVPFGRDLYEYGHRMVRESLRNQGDFDGIIAINDAAAIGAIRALFERKIRVPEDVSVVGFDDIMVSRFTVPALSTVVQPKEEMAETAIRLLVERIADPSLEARFVTLKTRFLPRASD